MVQNITLSGYVTDADGPQDCIKIHNGHMTIKDSLRSVIEEVDARIIPHFAASIEERLTTTMKTICTWKLMI